MVMRLSAATKVFGPTALCFVLAGSPPVFGQTPSNGLSRNSSTSSMFGSSATTSGAQSRTTSGTGSATTGLGSSMTLGSGQAGQTAMPFGTQTGQNRTFIGASSANVSNIMSMLGGSSAQGQRGFSNLQNLFNQSRQNTFNAQALQQNGQRGAGQSQTQLVVPIRLGFQRPPISAPQFSAAFSQRLTKMPALSGMGPIEVNLAGRTAILRGTVASESDRQLAESLARLEPEVAEVQNELVVKGPEATGESLPPTPGRP
jgi:hypothetical protein